MVNFSYLGHEITCKVCSSANLNVTILTSTKAKKMAVPKSKHSPVSSERCALAAGPSKQPIVPGHVGQFMMHSNVIVGITISHGYFLFSQSRIKVFASLTNMGSVGAGELN